MQPGKWSIHNGIVQNPKPQALQYGEPVNRLPWATTYTICQSCGMIDGRHKASYGEGNL